MSHFFFFCNWLLSHAICSVVFCYLVLIHSCSFLSLSHSLFSVCLVYIINKLLHKNYTTILKPIRKKKNVVFLFLSWKDTTEHQYVLLFHSISITFDFQFIHSFHVFGSYVSILTSCVFC